jgi:hypothetical protein
MIPIMMSWSIGGAGRQWITEYKIIRRIPSLILIPVQRSYPDIRPQSNHNHRRYDVYFITTSIQIFRGDRGIGKGWHPPFSNAPQKVPFQKRAASIYIIDVVL